MKRDLTLTRKILERIEDTEFNNHIPLEFQDYSSNEVAYHLKLLKDAGFIDAIDATSGHGEFYLPSSLTWEGHEFLDSIRNETALAKVKEKAGGDLSNIPFEVLKNVLGETIKLLFTP